MIHFSFALAAASLAFAPAHAATHDDEVRIRLSEYDHSSAADMHLLYSRIVAAADEVCRDAEYVGIAAFMAPRLRRTCRRRSVRAAVRQAGMPQLQAVHESLPRAMRYAAPENITQQFAREESARR